ncbi:MAG TPA: glycosyltransferase [Anaerolineae bacterium]|nr:glycosyltransferase [Anaerolineae bacterium]
MILTKTLNLGGAERLLLDAVPLINRQQFDYHFAYLLPEGNYLVPRFEAHNLPVHCLEMSSNYHFPLMLSRLHKLQTQHRFDLIHAHLPLPGILTRLVGRWNGIPVVYTEHNLPERLHPLTQRASKLTYGWNQQVWAVSQGVFDSLTRLGWAQKTNVTTLLNSVPVEQVRAEAVDLDQLRHELDIPREHLVVGTVAVFSRQKRLLDWLQVAHQIANQREGVTFVLAGYGPEEATLRAKVKALGLTDRVRMPGFRPDGRRILGLLDVYLMSSEFEGLPIALLEAMALARPVVATAVGGIPEVVTSGQEGFLTSVGDIDELVRHTIQLLNNPPLRQKMGQYGARKVAKEFHMHERIRAIEETYLQLLQVVPSKKPVFS